MDMDMDMDVDGTLHNNENPNKPHSTELMSMNDRYPNHKRLSFE